MRRGYFWSSQILGYYAKIQTKKKTNLNDKKLCKFCVYCRKSRAPHFTKNKAQSGALFFAYSFCLLLPNKDANFCIYKIDPRRKKNLHARLAPLFLLFNTNSIFLPFPKTTTIGKHKVGRKKVRILQNHWMKCESFTFCKPYLTPIQLKYKTPRILRTFSGPCSNLCLDSTISKTAFNGTLLF